jgi:hypothetical protein
MEARKQKQAILDNGSTVTSVVDPGCLSLIQDPYFLSIPDPGK